MPHTDVIPTSASIASTGKGIRYIGNWAYALSGQLDDVSTYATGLEFTTGSGIIKGIFQFDAMVQTSNTAAGDITLFKILINEVSVGITKLDGGQEDQPPTVKIPILLPPFTKVEVQYHGSVNSSDYPTFLRFTGRVYGAE
jgi:hypothetical protein